MQELNLDKSQRLNIACKSGDTFMWQTRFYSPDIAVEDDNPVNLANAIIYMQVRQMGLLKLSFVLGDGITLFATNGVMNGMQMSKSAIQMREIKKGKYDWDLKIEELGVVVTHLFGDFIVNEDVARA